MKKKFLFLVAAVLLGKFSAFAQELAWEDVSRENRHLNTVLVNPACRGEIYIGSDKGLFRSQDAGENWRQILRAKRPGKGVNFLAFDLQDKSHFYAACGEGLFYTFNRGRDWRRIFQGKNTQEAACTAVVAIGNRIYLGTKKGLFISNDKGRSWHKAMDKLSRAEILAISLCPKEPGYLYVAAVEGVFRVSSQDEGVERIFVSFLQENSDNADSQDNPDSQDSQRIFSEIRYLAVDKLNPAIIYLATAKGVYQSKDRGKGWHALTDYGLLRQEVKFILLSDASEVYAAGQSGIFKFVGNRWEELSFRLTAERINALEIDAQGNLYAASDEGLFRAKLAVSVFSQGTNLFLPNGIGKQPQIEEVQQAAIHYAEVEPEKILRWRRQAAKRAWLPKVTVTMDRDLDRTVSNSIWGIYSSNGTSGRHYVGPDDITKYDNKNWGVSLTWELADLIWNADQTGIDVRSRLLVELRQDLLDEVTKLYFERLRTEMELSGLSIEERKKIQEKELRLKELTAYLDALTGGYFSQRAEELKSAS